MNRRDLLIIGAGVAFSTRAAAQKRGAKRPNVVFILADDLGYADLSCYGRRDYRTPRLAPIHHGYDYIVEDERERATQNPVMMHLLRMSA